jgi:multidrug efflux pump subunit AcrA (membrane-fusion protein)
MIGQDWRNHLKHLSHPSRALWILAGLVIIWFLVGLFIGGKPPVFPPQNALFSVQVMDSQSVLKPLFIKLQGVAEAEHKVILKAETDGTVLTTPAQQGSFLKKSEPILSISLESLLAQLKEAEAVVAQYTLEYNNTLKLQKSSYRSKTEVAAALSKLEAAKANALLESGEVVGNVVLVAASMSHGSHYNVQAG